MPTKESRRKKRPRAFQDVDVQDSCQQVSIPVSRSQFLSAGLSSCQQVSVPVSRSQCSDQLSINLVRYRSVRP